MADKEDKAIADARKLIEKALQQMAKDDKKRAEQQEKHALGLEKLFTNNVKSAEKMNEVIDSITKSGGKYLKSIRSIQDVMAESAENVHISNKQIDIETKKAVDNIKSIIANSTTASKEFQKAAEEGLKHVNSYKKLADVVGEAADTVTYLSRLQQNFGEEEEDIIKNLRALGKTTEESQKIIQETREREINALEQQIRATHDGILTTEQHDEIVKKVNSSLGHYVAQSEDLQKTLNDEKKIHEDIVIAGGNAAKTLDALNKKSIAPFKKHIDESSEALKKNIANTLTVAFAVKKFYEGIKQGYNEFVKLNSVGLAGTFTTLQKAAVKYGMTFDQLLKITDENRLQMYQQTLIPGGAKSFDEAQKSFFTDMDELANQGAIQRYGVDKGNEIAAKQMKLVNQGGINPQSPAGKKIASQMLQSQLKLNAVTGESAETIMSNIESLRDLEENQAALSIATEEQRIAIMKNISTQYEQYRLNGLSAEQIKQRIQTEKDLANPLKGQFIEKIKAKFLGPMITALQAGLAGVKDTKQVREDQALVNKFRTEMNDEEKAKVMANPIELKKYTDAEDRLGKALLRIKGVNATSAKGGAINALAQLQPTAAASIAEEAAQKAAAAALNRGAGAGKQLTPEETAKIGAAAGAASTNKPMQDIQVGWEKLMNRWDSSIGKFLEGAFALLGAAAAHMVAAASLTLGGGLLTTGIGAMAASLGVAATAALTVGAAAMAAAFGVAVGTIINKAVEYLTGNSIGSHLYDFKDYITGGKEKNITKASTPEEIAEARKKRLAREAAAGVVASTVTSKTENPKIEDNKQSQGNAIKSTQQIKPVADKQKIKEREELTLKALSDAGVNDPKQQAILMGRISHESMGFSTTTELGNDSYFNQYDAGTRKGMNLGNTEKGDGLKYKGRGFIQLTGKSNYTAAGKALGLDLVNKPELAAEPEIAAKIAAWYVTTQKRKGTTAAELAMKGDIVGVTENINGGQNGLQDTIGRTQKYLAQLNNPQIPTTLASKVSSTTLASADMTQDVGSYDPNLSTMIGGVVPTSQTMVNTPTVVAAGKTQQTTIPKIVPPISPIPSPINNIDQMIADNTEKSNSLLASINKGIERLIASNNTKLASNAQKLPQTSTNVFNNKG